jgi:hypothetical protein
MTKHRFLMVLLIAGLSGCLLSSDTPKTANHTPTEYFPLSVGRYWKYEVIGATVRPGTVMWRVVTSTYSVDTLRLYVIHEYTTWDGGRAGPWRTDYFYTEGSVFYGGLAVNPILRVPLTTGESWATGAPGEGVTSYIINADAAITTPAGRFTESLKIEIAEEGDTTPETRYYAPHVGIVWSGERGISFELTEFGTTLPSDLPDAFDEFLLSEKAGRVFAPPAFSCVCMCGVTIERALSHYAS